MSRNNIRLLLTAVSLMLIIIFGMYLFFAVPSAFGAQHFVYFTATSDSVWLQWEISPEPDMYEYHIYEHRAGGMLYKNDTRHPVCALKDSIIAQKYYERIGFSVTAIDYTGNESAHSDTVWATFSQERVLFGDIDKSNKIDTIDLMRLNVALGAIIGELGFAENKDLNGDGKIDIIDKTLLLKNLGAVR